MSSRTRKRKVVVNDESAVNDSESTTTTTTTSSIKKSKKTSNDQSSIVALGVVHELPADLRTALTSDKNVLAKWNSLTPLARNEWICWTIAPKTAETRKEHVERVPQHLLEGKRRPCCWPGCSHRERGPTKKGTTNNSNTETDSESCARK